MSTEANTAEVDRTIRVAATGEEITFLETAEESGGGPLVMRLTLAPGGAVSPHAHPAQETFECLDGKIEFYLEGRSIELSAGATATARSGKIHGFRNVSQAPATMRIVVTPGAEMEYGLRLKMAMSEDGAFTSAGQPKDLLLGAVVLDRLEIYLPPLPVWLYRPLIGALAALGRWRGREQLLLARYPDYASLVDAHQRRVRGT